MIDPTIDARFWDFIIFGVFTVLLPGWTALVTLPRVRKLPTEVINRLRPRLYIEAIVLQWVMAAIALHPLFLRDADYSQLGLRITLPDLPRLAAGLGLVILALLALAWQRQSIKRLPEGRAMVREAVQRFAFLMPRTRNERILWVVVSLHAGICEELFFRGYMFSVLNSFGPWWAAAIAAALLFGMGHAYQGIRGVVGTGIIGVVAIGLYLLTGSLWVGMLAHVVYDVQGGEFGRWALYGKNDSAPNHA